MGHYCGFGPSVGLSEKSSYASSFPQFIGTNGTSNNWDYGGWHNSAYSGCHQQVYAAGISPGSGYNHVQRSCGNASVGPNDSDSTYWTVHAYQVPDHVQETCSTSFSTSDGFDDCYWSVRTFPVSSTKPHVTQAQPSLHDGAVGYSLKVPPKAEYHEMHVLKVSNPIPIENTLEGVPPEQQSQLCEKKEPSLEQQAFLKQKYDEAQDNLNQSEECHERSNEKGIHTLCRKLLADLEHIKEERKTRELEAQRKHEEEEIHKELEHFLYNAFNLFQEEHACEADIVELDAAYALSYLKEVVYDATLSLCHLNFGKWINQISKEQEQILVRGTLHFLQAVNIDAAKTLMSRTEINIKNQYVLTNKHNNTSPCHLNNGKEVPFIFLCQLPWSSVLCTWDPGIALSSYKYSWFFSTGRMLPSARENVGATIPPNVAAQAVGLAPVRYYKTNNTAGYDSLLVHDVQLPTAVQDDYNGLEDMPEYDVYEAEQIDNEQRPRTENRGISQSDFRETSTERDRNDAGNSIVPKTCQFWGFIPFQLECTIDAKLIIQWDPRFKNNREIALISLLHPVRTGVRLILLWDSGTFRSKIKTEWFPLQSDTTNVHPLLPWDLGDQEILVLIMLALNWQFRTFKEFEGSGEYTKQGVVPNNVNIPSCTLDRTAAMVVYMGSHKWIMLSDVSRLPSFVQSAAMKPIPAMILPGILGHVISGLICRSEHATNCLHMRCIFTTQIQTGHLRTMLVVIKFCSACLFSPYHHDLSLTESQVDLAHLFHLLQPAHITCYTPQLSTLLYNTIPSLTWDPESLAYRPEAIQHSIVLEDHSSKLAAHVQRVVESVVEDLTSRCLIIPSHHLSRAWRNLKMENLQTVNMAWVMELWIVTFLPP